jgi:hypothetical protein
MLLFPEKQASKVDASALEGQHDHRRMISSCFHQNEPDGHFLAAHGPALR